MSPAPHARTGKSGVEPPHAPDVSVQTFAHQHLVKLRREPGEHIPPGRYAWSQGHPADWHMTLAQLSPRFSCGMIICPTLRAKVFINNSRIGMSRKRCYAREASDVGDVVHLRRVRATSVEIEFSDRGSAVAVARVANTAVPCIKYCYQQARRTSNKETTHSQRELSYSMSCLLQL